MSRIIRHCDASERASVRKRGGGERKRLEKGGNVFRDLQTGRGDAGRRFRGWILGPRGWAEAGERLLKPGRGTDSTTYIRFLLSPPLHSSPYLCLSDGTAIENRPVMLAWDSFERNFRIACSFCTREQ